MIEISLNVALERIASQALKEVSDNSKLGLGSGSVTAKFVEALGKRRAKLTKLIIIPSSLQIKLLAEEVGLSLSTLMDWPSSLDLVVDGADQIDSKYNMIKGGGGALLKEKILISSAKKVIILAQESKFVKFLGPNCRVPIEVHPNSRKAVTGRLQDIGATSFIRSSNKGYPSFTENGNIILDADLGELREPKVIESTIKNIPGVIEVGIFTRTPDIIFKANVDGTIKKIVT